MFDCLPFMKCISKAGFWNDCLLGKYIKWIIHTMPCGTRILVFSEGKKSVIIDFMIYLDLYALYCAYTCVKLYNPCRIKRSKDLLHTHVFKHGQGVNW